MSDENLTQLLAKRAPKPRSKFTTALAAVLVLLIGVFIGAALGKSASSTTPTPGIPADAIASQGAGPTAGFGPGGARPASGTVDSVDGAKVSITTDGSSSLAPGDTVLVIKPPAGAPGPASAPSGGPSPVSP